MNPAIDIIGNNNCTGCYGCFNACAQDAIEMNLNNEGFMEPSIDIEKCLYCGICQKYCPIIDNQVTENLDNPISLAAWSKNDHTRIKSSSGGVFTEIAKIVLKEGGVVFGVAFDKALIARHISIENDEDISHIRGSKYIQSHVNDAYQKAISIALQGRPILFSGTPCQIAAINLFIPNNPILEIYTCEVICHGVPSESVFKAYLEYLSQLQKSEIREYSFRDNTLGWKNFGSKIMFKDGEEYFRTHRSDSFMIGFLRDIYLRPICYECPFAKLPRGADITLGDFWGVPKEIDDPRGVSAVIINTQKGENLFEKLSKVETVKVTVKQISRYNPRLGDGQLEQNPHTKDFYKLLESSGFEAVMEKYLKPYTLFQKSLRVPQFVYRSLLRYLRSRV